MADFSKIGVVTVTYNSAGVLDPFLACLRLQTHTDFLLYVVDNASNDGTLTLLSRWEDSRLRLITNPDNRGVAGGNNQGIEAALADGCSHVLLLNNDVEFGPDLFSLLLNAIQNQGAQMTCPKILYYDEPNRIWAAGGGFEPWVGYRSIHYGEDELDMGQYDQGKLVTYVATCCVLAEAQVFSSVGLMDERYFVYVDDTDFMYRAMKAGVKLYYVPQATLLHKVGRLTGGETSPFSIRFGTRNRQFFLLKHFGYWPALPWMMVCRVVWRLQSFRRTDGRDWLKMKHAAMRESLSLWRTGFR